MYMHQFSNNLPHERSVFLDKASKRNKKHILALTKTFKVQTHNKTAFMHMYIKYILKGKTH